MDLEKLLKSIKSNLKSLVLSEKNGYTEKKLWGHYQEFIGKDLEKESKKLGFSCLATFLESLRDIIRKGYNKDGEEVYKGVADDSTRHMVELISKTPVTKKKRRGMRGRGRGMLRGQGGMRGRGGFGGRGMRGNMGGMAGGYRGFSGRGRMGQQGGRNGIFLGNRLNRGGVGYNRSEGIQSTRPQNVASSRPWTPRSEEVGNYKPNVVTSSFSLQKISQGNYFQTTLQKYFDRHNLGSIPFKVSADMFEYNKFTASVWINSEEFKTDPQTFGSEAEAVEAVSKLCVDKLNIVKDGSVMKESSNKVMMVHRIEKIIEGKKFGVYNSIIEKQYEKKYGEQLPSLWWEEIKEMNVVKVEPLNVGAKIMIISPAMKLDEHKQNKCQEREPINSNPTTFNDLNDIHTEQEASQVTFSKLDLQNDKYLQTEVKVEETEDDPRQILPTLYPPEDKFWDVYITAVESAGEVYLRFIGEDYSERFDGISQEMDDFYENVDIPSVEEVVVGGTYAAKVDGDWHRVEVSDIDEVGNIFCWFLDHGDEDVIERRNIKELVPKFLVVPAQAFQVSLHGIEEVENEDTTEMLAKQLVGKSLIAQVEYAGDISAQNGDDGELPAVILFDTSNDSEGVNINKKIMDEMEMLAPPTTDETDSNISTACSTIIQDIAKTQSNQSVEDQYEIKLANALMPKEKKPLPVLDIPRVNDDFDVLVAWAASPTSFVVQPLKFADQHKDLMLALKSFYNDPSNRTEMIGDVFEGEFLAALHEDGYWYRVEVVRQISHKPSLLVVRFVDYGKNCMTSVDKLQPLTPEFRQLPMQAILAKLADVHPSTGVWTQEEICWFNDRVVGKEFVSRIKGVTEGASGEMMMEVVLIDTSHPHVDKYVAKELLERK